MKTNVLRMGVASATLAMIAMPSVSLAATKTFLIGSFEELIVDGDIMVVIDNNKAPSAKASGDKALIEAVKIERNGLQIRIRIQDYEGKTQTVRPNDPLVINLGGRGVKRISANGSASIRMNDLRAVGDTASLKLSGPGSISVGRLDSDRLIVNLTGSGLVEIGAGRARSAQISVDGTGAVTAGQLTLQQAKLAQTGNAKTHLSVTDTAEITNSGAGTITIDGKATCFVRQPGSARIICAKTAKP